LLHLDKNNEGKHRERAQRLARVKKGSQKTLIQLVSELSLTEVEGNEGWERVAD
jgi:hypothetical protein